MFIGKSDIQNLSSLLLVQSSSIEPKCFGSGYKPFDWAHDEAWTSV